MTVERRYDIVISGGGLAGLSLSILLARTGWKVCVLEKETYPLHKVCGEYISMESWDFLCDLGLPLEKWNLPKIHRFQLTAPNGKFLSAELPLGGFGLSRYKLDAELAVAARKAGVDLYENCKVQDITFENDIHRIKTTLGEFIAPVSCACFGKKSNLDVKWKRSFLSRGSENYVGVKYHIQTPLEPGLIALHNFPGGYCGVSAIEDNRYCFCYLTTSRNLKKNQQSIPAMEEKILKKNPVLKKLLDESLFIFDDPLTIAQISFRKKTQTEKHTIFIGDAAGMITPLCGNGMSMAFHGSKIVSPLINEFLQGKISRLEMEKKYQETWNRQFAGRLRAGRLVQRFFGSAFRSSLLIAILKPLPSLVKAIIRRTHGEQI